MKRIFTFLLCLFAVTFAMGQNLTGVFAHATVAPVLDGVVDAVWSEATAYSIERTAVDEVPTIGTPGQTTWQAMWDDKGVYVLLKVTDDTFYPNYLAPGFVAGVKTFEDYSYDKPELYFDVNAILVDAGGPGSASPTNLGHHQFAPGFALDQNDGRIIIGTDKVQHAFLVTGSNYVAEYFVPYALLTDNAGFKLDRTIKIGFDVIIIDRDAVTPLRQQGVWSGGNWMTMDLAGEVTFADAVMDTYIDEIALTGGTITTPKGTLQIVATLVPVNPTFKDLNWSVANGTGKATIDANGLLTALTDGTVTVTAKSTDIQGAQISIDVEITGQSTTSYDIWNNFNLIKNWNFNTDLTSWSGWVDTDPKLGLADQKGYVVNGGVVVMGALASSDTYSWHYQFNQSDMGAEANIAYVLKFKSWSDVERLNNVDFEDIAGNQNNRYGISPDTEATGRSDWTYTTTSDPKWFVFHVTFDQLKDNSVQKIQWAEAQAAGTAYLDSVLLIKQTEYDLLLTLPANTAVKTIASSINRVYPSPVGDGNTLFVELSSAKTNVVIYNAVGQKMMEKVSTGTIVKFDVSSLRKGLYFVKLSDGSTQKFIR